ncbi:hypothetical protein EG329_001361 [Mollisiaceae sp. DMI_Dod_QoI]|nr:hypothetical protein EG329_001361 [Helotiales sp. DMI_Dod_QoI]
MLCHDGARSNMRDVFTILIFKEYLAAQSPFHMAQLQYSNPVMNPNLLPRSGPAPPPEAPIVRYTNRAPAEPEQKDLSVMPAPNETEDLTGRDTEPPAISTKLRKIMRALPASVVVVTTSLTGSAAPGPGHNTNGLSALEFGARGMTVSSFTTLTLTPYPIIQFNVKIPSRTLEALIGTRHFLVHILEASKTGAKVAHAFTKGNASGPDGTVSPFVDPGAFKVKPMRVAIRKWLIDGDGTYVRHKLWKEKRDEEEAKKASVPDHSESSNGPPAFKQADLSKDVFQTGKIPERITEVILPRLVSDGVLRTLHCKVLDRGARGGRGDGLVKVGDHMIVLAQVHEVIESTPVEEISHKNQKGLAYAHGNFTATRPIIDPNEPEEPRLDRLTSEVTNLRQALGEISSPKVGEEVSSQPTTETFSAVNQGRKSESRPNQDNLGALNTTSLPEDIKQEDTAYQGGSPPIRKIPTKGLPLREINEQANYYIHKANNLRAVPQLPPAEQTGQASGLKRPLLLQEDQLEAEQPGNLEKPKKKKRPEGPRITKHATYGGKSIVDIQEAKQIGIEYEIPRRIAEEAVKALPNADIEQRKEYALLKAAEELAARREEIAAMNLRDLEYESGDVFSVMRSQHRRDLDSKDRKMKIREYEISSPELDPELQLKLENARKKIENFKTLEYGLRKAENEEEGLFWRPERIVKDQNKEKAREELERKKEIARAEREAREKEFLAAQAKVKELELEYKRTYQEADPWAEEFP